ncbi:MAG TPA: DUF2975 domain-containing protein [Sphingopyxis sp.]|nr:DUF2975 domain-containing protein [Sphingopyxis sp.]HMP44122.1 DUF2975 domain-containing protein [Sphingopyxis sp.]HMQ20730.1 DUF2975 domain-containing protein [Sphingopyxis sp.]
MPADHSALMGITRALLWLILGLVAAAILFVLVAGGALAVAWPDIVVEAKKSGVFLDAAAMRPQLFALLALLLAILAATVDVLRQLQALVASAAADPFIPENAGRLRRIGWALVAVHLLALPLGWVAGSIAKATSKFAAMGGINLTGILAILLAFVLAAVFERGAAMRDELEGTV